MLSVVQICSLSNVKTLDGKTSFGRGSDFIQTQRHLPLRPQPIHRPFTPLILHKMASINTPRACLRTLSRATPSLRSASPRIATRCLHQKASPITSSPLQRRPRVQTWSQSAAPIAATVSRRTMFIQTEPTPNADVCSPPKPIQFTSF